MKYYVRLRNEKGKEAGIGGNEYIDIDVMVGNRRMATFTLRHTDDFEDDGEADVLYGEDDEAINWLKK